LTTTELDTPAGAGTTIDVSGTFSVTNTANTAFSIDAQSGGQVTLDTNVLLMTRLPEGTVLTAEAGGSITDNSQNFNGAITANADGGNIDFTSTNASLDGGTFTINAGGSITADGQNINAATTVDLDQGTFTTGLTTINNNALTVNFEGSNGVGNVFVNSGVVGTSGVNFSNMGIGDTINLNDATITKFDSYNSSTHKLVVETGAGQLTINNVSTSASVANPTFQVTAHGGIELLCFLRGTLIDTPNGSRPVESLIQGDQVLTADGQVRSVRWLWRQTVVSIFADKLRAYPIRIMAGALGENLPDRDLYLSPDHAILIEGCLIHAGALVNNTTILRMADPEPRFVYYHIELEDHSLILAHGVSAETFVDNVTRRSFDNYDEYEAFYGDADQAIVEMEFPRAKSARQVPLIVRERVAAHALGLFGATRDVA
jgi:hypothetical protein